MTLYRQLEEWILSLHSRDELAAASLLIPSFILDHHASNAFLQLINTSNRTSNHGLKVDLVTFSPLCKQTCVFIYLVNLSVMRKMKPYCIRHLHPLQTMVKDSSFVVLGNGVRVPLCCLCEGSDPFDCLFPIRPR